MNALYVKLIEEAGACVDRVAHPPLAEGTDMESLVRKNEAATALSLIQAAMTLRKVIAGR